MLILLFYILLFHATKIESLFNPTTGVVVVIGGTGRLGRTIVKNLLDQGVETRLLVRNIEKAQGIEEIQGASFIEGNIDNINNMLEVTKNAGAIIDCHGVSPPRLAQPLDLIRHPRHVKNHPYTVNFIGTKTLLTAMTINKCNKLVRVTGALTGKPAFAFVSALFNLILSMTCKWHERSEIAIRESGIDYTVVRPTGIKDTPIAAENNRSLVLLHGDSDEQVPLPGQISLRDIATLCVQSITDTKLSKSTVIVSSVEGNNGEQSWDNLIALKAKPDYKTIIRRPHDAAAVLMGLSIASFITLFSRGFYVLLQFLFRATKKYVFKTI